ncbi:MAG: DUF1684 domain-containing protein [Cyclobacteriaceae bacterium]
MKNIKWIVIAAVLAIVAFSIFSSDDGTYQTEVNQQIEERISYLKNSSQSPFKLHNIPFNTPEYFEIDERFRVNAKVERLSDREFVQLQTSDGKSKRYQKFAWLHFTLDDEDMKLLVLRPWGLGEKASLFLAFADDTSGETTYGGGRYLDIEIGKSNKVVLDFNLAYNPYCAYASAYSCPLPPNENILKYPVLAGEKSFLN